MGITSAIEWTDATWNPWQGCTKVSPACTNCYMFSDLKRYGRDGSIVVRSKPPTFNLPMTRRKTGEYAIADGMKVFTCSWSDWFHQVADPWRAEAWEIIRRRPGVIFQIVTKRPERIAQCLPPDWGNGYPNVWLIATAENQEYLERRIFHLVKIPAAVHGLSIEPQLGPMTLTKINNGCGETYDALRAEVTTTGNHKFRTSNTYPLRWIVNGFESGSGARPGHPQWTRNLLGECSRAGTPFFFKQWGDYAPLEIVADADQRERVRINSEGRDVTELSGLHDPTDAVMVKVGKKAAGRMLDGQLWSQFPQTELMGCAS